MAPGNLGRSGTLAGAVLGAAMLAAASIVPTVAARAGEVSCDGFALGYDGEAKSKKCAVEDSSTGQLESQTKTLEVLDHAYSIFVTYDHTGFRTYIPAQSAMEILARERGFTHKTPLGTSRQIGGLDTIAFRGIPTGKSYELYCAYFVRYSGNPGNYEFDYGPGAKNAVRGIYCADPGFLTAAQQGDGFYDLVAQVIGRLKLPNGD
jgi:hypothetical protein